MKRPEHLPAFTSPPLDEVVVGVQFAPVQSYTPVNSRDVWELFKSEFPKVQEQSLLPQQFETFGGANLQPSIHFQIGAPLGSRLWFISEAENHLLQFQSDRFLMNWKKNPNPQPYPRFEGIADAFEKHLISLAKHLDSQLNYALHVNQAEITYINNIPIDDFANAGRWLSVWNDGILNIENLNTSFNEIVNDKTGKAYARLFHAIQSANTLDGKHKVLNLSLTFRGKPLANDIEAAMSFLRAGREAIVMRFKQMTTAFAHQHWGIQK